VRSQARSRSSTPAYQQRLAQNGYIYDRSGRHVLAVLRGSQARVLVGRDDIAGVMKQAIVAVEDKRFFEHRGVDLRAILRAVWADIRNKSAVQGGSTITQQFIKNAYVSSQSSVARKLKEAALAWQLEQQWSKDRILTAYLNTIYFANGAYGVEQASREYFHHPASELTLPEAALLAGIPQDPSRYDPVSSPRAARGRRALVLSLMLQQHMITPAAYRAAVLARLPDPESVRLPGTQGPAPYFVNYVKQLLIDGYGAQEVFGGGLRVKTSIDLGIQDAAREAIKKWLENEDGPSAALVAIDPRTGAVLAMVGGNNFRENQFNLAVQGERQPGSAFKPFVLATALQDGISPETHFESKPVEIPIGGRVWQVNNYEDDYLGDITVETGTIYSDNAVYAQLTSLVDPGAVARTARRLGVRSPLRNYFSIGLGAQAVNPLEMARAFSAFANGGFRVDGSLKGLKNHPRAILSVGRPGSGTQQNAPDRARVLRPETAALATSLLQEVVQQGTGRRAQLSGGRPTAGKTGTTENYGDAWFVGYTPQLVAAVWVGYPNVLRPMLTDFHGDPVAGGTYPALIWKAFMERALPALGAEPQPFPARPPSYGSPANVVDRNGRLRLDNGYCHGSVPVVLLAGGPTPPQARCKPNEVAVPHVVGQSVAHAQASLAAQPLRSELIWKPAKAADPVGVVLRQFPAGGSLSSYQSVKLVVARPLHGTVPDVVGKRLVRARSKLARRRLAGRVVELADGPHGKVIAQKPRSGVAAAPGMVVRLVLGR
jgi:penicillin-binding protein 1A